MGRKKIVIAISVLVAGSALFAISQKPAAGIGTSRPENTDREVRALRVAALVLPAELHEAGTLAGWREVDVVAELSGRVVAPPVGVGTDVAQGETLARLDPTALEIDLRGREAKVREAELALRVARREAERLVQLRDDGVVSESEWDRVDDTVWQMEAALTAAEAARDAAREALADTRVRAPFAGRVVRRYTELGAFVAVGAPIARLVDLSRLRLQVGAPAGIAVSVEPGLEVSLEIDAYPGERFVGRLNSISAEADVNGLFPIEIVTEGIAGRPLLPGMVARAQIVADRGEPHVLVPPSAVARRDGRDVIFVVDDEATQVRQRVVSLGARNGYAVEIVAGIEAGELIAYEGHAGLEEGDAVRILDAVDTLPRDLRDAVAPASAARDAAGDGIRGTS